MVNRYSQRKVVVTALRNVDGAFAECIRWHLAKSVPFLSVLGDTWQKVSLFTECLPDQHSAKKSPTGPFASTFAECTRRHSAKVASLLRAKATTLGKEVLLVPRCAFFAECYDFDTRQSDHYTPFFICFCYSIQTNKKYHRHHIIITDITYTSHISQGP